MPRIDQETVQRILDAADIVDVVSDFVKLRRSGANYKGLCPFHNERTPSFSVNKARNICKCFSCGKGGSPVNFIMEHEQMSFQEALRYLARKYNIEIVEKELSAEERQAESKREALMAVNAFALDHFEHNLSDTSDGQDIALAYFRHRGISDAMISRFHLGYALEKNTALIDAAKEAGFILPYLVETGLAVETDRDGVKGAYDRFRGRVIFPIHTLSGRVVGFGGRTMRSDKNIAKYVNSPESEIYHKKNELYGLYQARAAIGRKDKCIMVEGYMDVISMHQAGVENVVASSGTSLTEEQIRAIRRFTENVTLIYDADAAGIKASLRGINMLLTENFNVKTLLLPPGEDPDSFAQTHSAAEVEQYLNEHEQDIVAFMTDILMKEVNPSDPTAKARVVNEVLRSIAFVEEPVKRQEYISQCSRMVGVSEDILIQQLNIFIAKRHEDAYNAARREKARESIKDIEEEKENTTATQQSDTPLIQLSVNRMKPYEKMLLRYVVRYGLLCSFDMTTDDASVNRSPVFDIIDNALRMDEITISHPPYAKTFEALRAIRNGGWLADRAIKEAELEKECASILAQRRDEISRSGATMDTLAKKEQLLMAEVEEYRNEQLDEFDILYGQTRLINSADDDVRATASELLVDRYSLSRIYTKQENFDSEQSQISHLVERAIHELRSAIVSGVIEDLTKQFANIAPGDDAGAIELLKQLSYWKQFQQGLGKMLGERIILPKT